MKTCCKCKKSKHDNQFPARSGGGLGPYCWPCKRQYDRDYWSRTKVRRNKRKRQNGVQIRLRNRAFVRAYLEKHPCVDCGENDPVVLDFHHVRGRKNRDISTLVRERASLRAIKAEIAKCVVCCANCHRRRTHKYRSVA